MNHEKLSQEFILIVFENKSEIIKFTLKIDLDDINSELDDIHNTRIKLTDLTQTG